MYFCMVLFVHVELCDVKQCKYQSKWTSSISIRFNGIDQFITYLLFFFIEYILTCNVMSKMLAKFKLVKFKCPCYLLIFSIFFFLLKIRFLNSITHIYLHLFKMNFVIDISYSIFDELKNILVFDPQLIMNYSIEWKK